MPAGSALPGAPVTPPKVSLSEGAVTAFKAAESDAQGDKLRLEIDAQFQYELYFGPARADDVQVEANGMVILFDPASARRADGLSIDFVDRPGGGGFKIDEPQRAAAREAALVDGAQGHAGLR